MHILGFDIDAQMLPSLIGLGGIGIAAILGGIGYILRLHGERLSTRRSVLFYLLEIRYRIESQISDPETAAENYLKECREHLLKKNIPEDFIKPEELLPLINQLFTSIFDDLKRQLDQELMTPFHHAVIKLSGENPILAYRLYGLNSIEKVIASQKGAFSSISDHPDFKDEPAFKAVMPAELRRVRNSGIQDLTGDLDTLIKDVAKTCSIIDRIKTHQILKKRKITTEINLADFDIKQALDEIFSNIEKALKDLQENAPTDLSETIKPAFDSEKTANSTEATGK